MANGNGNATLNYIYKGGMAILFVILCFLASKIYSEVNAFPTAFVPLARYEAIEKKVNEIPITYPTLERYKCDIEKIERSLNRIDRKLDRALPHVATENEP
jgi:tetrahydromethanopterin S-methyltransferase subunit G